MVCCNAHGFCECARQLDQAVLIHGADDDYFSRLVGAQRDRTIELTKRLRKIRGMRAGKGGNLLIHGLKKFNPVAISKECRYLRVTQSFEEIKIHLS